MSASHQQHGPTTELGSWATGARIRLGHWGEELLNSAVRHRPHGPWRSYMSALDRATPDRLLGPGLSYIVHTGPGGAGSTTRARAVPHRQHGPGDVESTDRDYSESLVRTRPSLCPLMLRHRDQLGHGCDRQKRCATIWVGTYASTDVDYFENQMRVSCAVTSVVALTEHIRIGY